MPRTGRLRYCLTSSWPTGWPPLSMWRGLRSARPTVNLSRVSHRRPASPRAARGSEQWPCTGCWVSFTWRAATQTRALEEFERELMLENAGQLYARECAANTWYAIGALRLRQGRPGTTPPRHSPTPSNVFPRTRWRTWGSQPLAASART